jgi:farnesyl diphosphate synthase
MATLRHQSQQLKARPDAMTSAAPTFEEALAHTRAAVEQRLAARLPNAPETPARLAAAMRHAVLGGGKRFRPFLVTESARLFGADADSAVEVAAALECVHCYSLVHDDLPAMDNDALRRGLPTVWKAFDEWTAILAGDALLTLAFELIAAPALAAPAETKLRLAAELARASGAAGMVGGQALDLEADKRGEPAQPDFSHVRSLQAMKTGALIRFAAMSGPILAGRPESDVRRLARYGDHLGYAFQISDDLLDATGSAVAVGKAVGKDAAAGKATLVSLMGLEAARAKLAEIEAAAIAEVEPFGASAGRLVAAARFMTTRQA